MKRCLLCLFVCAIAGGPAAAQHWRYSDIGGGNRVAELETTARTTAGPKPGRLYVQQIDGRGGNLLLGLNVELDPGSGFDVGDFEGPDAPFGEHRLATLRFRSSAGGATVQCKGGGWWASPSLFAFVVAITTWPARIQRHVRRVLLGRRLHIVFEVRHVGGGEPAIRAEVVSRDSPEVIQAVLGRG